MHVSIYLAIYLSVYISIYFIYLSIAIYLYRYIYIYTYIYIHTYVYSNIYMYIYIYRYMCVYYIYVCMYIYTHMYIYIPKLQLINLMRICSMQWGPVLQPGPPATLLRCRSRLGRLGLQTTESRCGLGMRLRGNSGLGVWLLRTRFS